MVSIQKSTLNSLLFTFAYIIYLAYNLLSVSFYYKYIASLGNLVIISCISLLLLKELRYHKFNYKDLLILLFSSICFVLFYKNLGINQAILMLFVYSARNINMIEFFKLSYKLSFVLLLFIIISGKIGIIENYTGISGERQREYLGFRYALYPTSILGNIVFLKIYIERKNITWLALIILFVSSVILYLFTDSRLTTGISIIIIVLAALFKKYNSIENIFKRGYLIISYIVSAVISIYFTLKYDYLSEWQSNLNELLGGRLSLGNMTLDFYGIDWFGKKINLIGMGLDADGEQNMSDTYDYVDNLYIQLLLRMGILFLIIFILIMTMMVYKAYKNKDVYLVIILVLLAFHGIIDDLILSIQFNSFFMVVSTVLYTYNKTKNYER